MCKLKSRCNESLTVILLHVLSSIPSVKAMKNDDKARARPGGRAYCTSFGYKTELL